MPHAYITFGNAHVHSINQITIDKDCIARIECNSEIEGREKAIELFGRQWSDIHYNPTTRDIFGLLQYYPRGIIEV